MGYALRVARSSNEPEIVPRHPPDAVDVNRVISYNLRIAREQKGWTQEQFADRLEVVTGRRPTQTSVSALERAWEGRKRREFDAQELVDFAVALNVPVVWFFLPPPGDRREIKNTGRQLFALIDLLVGRAEHLPRIEERLREIGLRDNTAEEEISRILTGRPDAMTPQVIRELRERMLAQILHEMAEALDDSIPLWKSFFDRLDKTTVRGMIAALANDPSLLGPDQDFSDDTDDPTLPVDAESDNAGDGSGEPDGPTGADIDEASAAAAALAAAAHPA